MTEIFKTDSKGKLRVIRYSTDGDKLIMESGLVGGNLTRNETICQPKNIGKSNEITGAQRALAMMASKIKTKTRKEYHMTQEAALSSADDVFPMLAKDYAKEARKVDWGSAFVQPKLDGFRCLSFIEDGSVRMMTRSNKEILTLPHIAESLKRLPNGIYDGEAYAHGLTFQQNQKLITKNRGEATEQVNLMLYDMVNDEPFIARYNQLKAINEDSSLSHVGMVTTLQVGSEFLLRECHDQFVENGFEGAILRWGDEGYKSKGRSSHLLKYKVFEDMDSVVIDVLPYEARPTHGLLVCQDEQGITFKADLSGTHGEREALLMEKDCVIGSTVQVRYFGRTDANIPRFAKAIFKTI